MPNRVQAQPFFRPALEEQRYLPECPLVIGGSLVWISIQYAADRPQGGINVLDLASRENVHHPLPGRPGFFAKTADPRRAADRPGAPPDTLRSECRRHHGDSCPHSGRSARDHQRRHRNPRRGHLRHQAPGVQPAGRRALPLRPRHSQCARTARRTDVLQRKVSSRWPAGGHRQPAEDDHRISLRWRPPSACD